MTNHKTITFMNHRITRQAGTDFFQAFNVYGDFIGMGTEQQCKKAINDLITKWADQ